MSAFGSPQFGWRKSSYSGGNAGGSNCVEVASSAGAIGVRDSKDPGCGTVAITPAGWQRFITALKDGDLTVG